MPTWKSNRSEVYMNVLPSDRGIKVKEFLFPFFRPRNAALQRGDFDFSRAREEREMLLPRYIYVVVHSANNSRKGKVS